MKRSRIWIFDENRLKEALESYEQAAIKAYPNQEEKIRITVMAMQDFLHSEHAEKLVMGQGDEE